MVKQHHRHAGHGKRSRMPVSDKSFKLFDMLVVLNDFGRLKNVGFKHPAYKGYGVDCAYENAARAEAV
ncbi:hypothetical protein LVJ83_00080 [Uruburuella testudinis]|uniref:Uncharacterized protein n=1 Tax=Uruburuella testudinis TaxID=1282863 RepID=A0ABY4DSA0_9NEIS|nr:hypothetical protein [Uruburuella testudinis]UOO81916.1 hypothetical protein LVJ83_00080 [Uruburuella testudinis]